MVSIIVQEDDTMYTHATCGELEEQKGRWIRLRPWSKLFQWTGTATYR